jgi:hypothetical protein
MIRQTTPIEDIAVQMSTFKRQANPLKWVLDRVHLELSNNLVDDSAGRSQTAWWGCGFVLVRNRPPSSRVALHNVNLYPLK